MTHYHLLGLKYIFFSPIEHHIKVNMPYATDYKQLNHFHKISFTKNN